LILDAGGEKYKKLKELLDEINKECNDLEKTVTRN
jgi:hypothetical protein